MDEKIIIDEINRLITCNFKDIFVIDIIDDLVYEFKLVNGNLEKTNASTYVEFTESIAKKIHPNDLNDFFNKMSLNNLELSFQSGVSEHRFKYRHVSETGDFHPYLGILNYIVCGGKKLIFLMSEDIFDRLTSEEQENAKLQKELSNYEKRINEETESISEAILKINNVLDTNEFGSSKMANAKDYINSVFSRVSMDHPELNKAIISKISNEANYRKPTILIVDDSAVIRNSLKRIFAEEFNILFAKNGIEAIELIKENVLSNGRENIVGILLDLLMPEMDGFGVLDFLNNNKLLNRIPVAIISGDEKPETRKKVYQYEIVDMLEKPFNTENIRRRISKIINLYISGNNLQSIVDIQNVELNNKEKDNIENLKLIIKEITENIRNSKESSKIKKLAHIFASNIYSGEPDLVDRIVEMSPLYNIGAIAINDDTLITKDAINKEISYGLTIADSVINDQKYLDTLYDIIKYSCEMYDGSGYPNGLSGTNIPMSASITNIVIRLNQYSKIHKFAGAYKLITENEVYKYNSDLIKILEANKKEIANVLR